MPIIDTSLYYVIKLITQQQILEALSSLGAEAVRNDRVVCTRLPDGDQPGDAYYIRLRQGASRNNLYPERSEETGIPYRHIPTGYYCDTEFSAYTASSEPEQITTSTVDFDSLAILGRQIRFTISSSDQVPLWVEGEAVSASKLYYSNGHYYALVSGSRCGSIQPTHVHGIVSDGESTWRYVHSGYGVGTVISVTDSTHCTIKVEDGFLPVTDLSRSEYEFDNYQWSIWGYNGVYPDQVFTFNGRLGYVTNTDGYGSWLHLSKSDNYEDFGVQDFGDVTDICGINVVLSAHQDNRINWVMSGYRLYMGSYSGEYNIKGDNASGVITPSSLAVLGVSAMGGERVEPLKYNELNLFVGYTGKEFFSLHYDYSSDDYVPEHISYVAESVFASGIKRMTLLKDGDNDVFCRSGNNDMFAINYQEELKVLSAFRNYVSGEVLDIATSHSSGDSCAFFVLKDDKGMHLEYIDSVDKDYMLSAKRVTVEEGSVPQEIVDLDFANEVVYVKDLVTEEFKKVQVEDDGVIHHDYVTSNLVYGRPMPCELHFNPAFGEKLEGHVQKSVRFVLRVINSGPFSYGSSTDFSKYYEYKNVDFPDDKHMTGDVSLPSSFGYMQGQNTADGEYPNDTGTALNLFTDAPMEFNLLMISEMYV